MNTPRYYTTGTAAQVAGCHNTTIWRAITRGELEAHRLGQDGSFRITPEALDAWLHRWEPKSNDRQGE